MVWQRFQKNHNFQVSHTMFKLDQEEKTIPQFHLQQSAELGHQIHLAQTLKMSDIWLDWLVPNHTCILWSAIICHLSLRVSRLQLCKMSPLLLEKKAKTWFTCSSVVRHGHLLFKIATDLI